MNPAYKWLSRSTVFAIFFAITGFILACKGLLCGTYVALGGMVHGYITARAIAEDYHERQTDHREDNCGK